MDALAAVSTRPPTAAHPLSPVGLTLVFHAHQPWGNTPEVVARLTAECYRPFVEALKRAPHVRCGFHVSGPLLMNWAHGAPDLIEDLRALTQRRQIEWLLSGLYEPVLAAWPSRDRRLQIRKMREYLTSLFGPIPGEGLWLTERVWEPSLVGDLRAEGVRYTLVDDHLFFRAGWTPGALRRPLITEWGGERLTLLPILERMRYVIPFKPVEALDRLMGESAESGGGLLVYGDDVEKFGAWPGTREWVYERGWLNEFWEWLKRSPCEPPSEALARWPAEGPCYLPTGSYREMEEWATPHFFVKYAEANWLHKKVLALSALARGISPRRRLARGETLVAQGNDVYWHGIFGGLYLPHLRRVAWRHVCRAETLLAPLRPTVRLGDWDADGRVEAWLKTPVASATVKVPEGEVVDYLPFQSGENVFNVLSRRPEPYHRRDGSPLPATGGDPPGPGISSIHDQSFPQGETTLAYDPGPKRSGRLHLWPAGEAVSPQAFERGFLTPLLPSDPDWRIAGEGRLQAGAARLELVKAVPPLTMIKIISLDLQGRLVIQAACRHEDPAFRAWAAMEWNVDAQPGDALEWEGSRAVIGSGRQPVDRAWQNAAGVDEFRLAGRDGTRVVAWRWGTPCGVWWQPIVTWSQSESGMEWTVQGLTLLAVWPVAAGQETSFTLACTRGDSESG